MYTQLEQRGMDSPPVNVSTLRNMKASNEPIACLTHTMPVLPVSSMMPALMLFWSVTPWEWLFRGMTRQCR